MKFLPNKSPGADGLRSDTMCHLVDTIAYLLTHICNLSFLTGIIRNELKLGKISPIYKKDDPILFTNYRPISVLPVLSKVIERLMYNRLMDYLKNNNILSEYQFGFREKYGTHLALILLENKIATAIDEGKYSICLCLDLSKAFDTIDNKILLKNLEHYGVRGLSLMDEFLSWKAHINHVASKVANVLGY